MFKNKSSLSFSFAVSCTHTLKANTTSEYCDGKRTEIQIIEIIDLYWLNYSPANQYETGTSWHTIHSEIATSSLRFPCRVIILTVG